MLPSFGLSVFIKGDSRKQIKSKIPPSYNCQSPHCCHSQNDVSSGCRAVGAEIECEAKILVNTECLCLGRSLQLIRGFVKRWWGGMSFLGVPPMAFIAPRVPSCPLFASVHLPMSHRNPSLLPGPRWLWKQVRHECGGTKRPLCILQWWPPDSPGDMICYPLSSFHLSLPSELFPFPTLNPSLPFWVIMTDIVT